MTPDQIAGVAAKLNTAYHAHQGNEAAAASTPLPDWLLSALNDALKDSPITAAAAAPAAPGTIKLIAVRYIGRREVYKEGTYGTGMVFQQGETKLVPADKAVLMLKHPDVYVRGAASVADASVSAPLVVAKQASENDDPIQMAHDSIAHMPKDAVIAFVKTHFRQDIDKRTSEANARNKANQLIDQFGLG